MLKDTFTYQSDVIVKLWQSLHPFDPYDCAFTVEEDMKIFHELLQSINNRYLILETTFGTFQAISEPFGMSDTITLKSVHSNTLFFESTSRFVTPFDQHLVDKVVWQSLQAVVFRRLATMLRCVF